MSTIEHTFSSGKSNGYFLLAFSTLMSFQGYQWGNHASTALGIGCACIAIMYLLLLRFDFAWPANGLVAFGLPLTAFFCPYFFPLRFEITVTTFGYMYIGGLMYTAWCLQDQRFRKMLWASMFVFFICMVFYDKIIIRHFPNSHFEEMFKNETLYKHFKLMQLTHFITVVFIILLIQKNKFKAEFELKKQILKIRQFTNNLISSSKSKLIHSGNLVEALEEIIRNTASTMNVSRVSIWEYNDHTDSIDLIAGYDLERNSYMDKTFLLRKNFPTYFKALLEEKIVTADDVMENPKTQEFVDSYLKPLQIKSMMDVPFFIDGAFKGILCFEEQRNRKHWDNQDQLFATSMSKMISIAYYCCMRREQFEKLLSATRDLEKNNSIIQTINQKIIDLNGTLHEDLHIKEKNLEELQDFLNELSFKNAHQVRGPLSRILGLVYLYQMEKDSDVKMEYIKHIDHSAKELDEMIREISKMLNQRV
ncbi:MAG: GAF domain-containing protein [Cytophagaceae bacterium]|jgi:hypothetical protein|nr:GAF domain-containing protein [Cytophagaceae bacterium]